MRSVSVIPALLLTAVCGASCRPMSPKGGPDRVRAAPGSDQDVRPSGLETRAAFSLPNGLHVLLEENHAAPLMALQLWLGVGAADEPPGLEGAANVVRHALRRSVAAAGSRALARTGAWVSHDQTALHLVVASAFVDDGLRALGGAAMAPSLTAPDFEAARAAARDDLRLSRGDPERVAAAAALAAAFTAHPYRRALFGTDAQLATLQGDAVRAFFEGAYGAGNATLVIVGDFDSSVVRERVTAVFGGWRRGAGRLTRVAEPAQQSFRVVAAGVEGGAAELSLVWRTPDFLSGDRAALQVLAALLGRGSRSRFDAELVRNRQLAAETSAFLFAARDSGLLVSRAVLGPGPIEDAARAMLDEVSRLATDGPTSEELRRARMLAEAEEVAQKAGLDGYAGRLALYATLAGDAEAEAAHRKRLHELDVQQVKRAAARYLRSSALTVVVGIPPGQARAENKEAALTARLRAVVTAADARGPAKPSKVSPPSLVRDVVTYALPSGVRVLIFADDGADEVAVRAVWSGGVRVEDSRLAGATSLLARLLARATKTRSSEQLTAELADLGGRMEGFAGLDVLGVRGEFLAASWERGLDLLVDCLRNPRFSEDDVEQDRRVLLDAIRLRDEDPGAVATRLFDDNLFARHPYHQDVLGSVDSVATLTRRRLLDFFRAQYQPRGLTLVVVGAVDPGRVAERVQALFADAPATESVSAPASAAVAASALPREVVRFAEVGLARIVLGYPGVSLRDPDRLALDVLAEVLTGAGRRLSVLLRSRRGPIDQLVARSLVAVEPGRFSLHATVRPEQVEAAVAALRVELGRILEAGVTLDEVVAARRSLIGKRALALERRGAVASALAFGAALGDPARSLRRDSDELAAILPEDVLRAARRIIDPKREVLAVIRPRASAGSSTGRASLQRPSTQVAAADAGHFSAAARAQ